MDNIRIFDDYSGQQLVDQASNLHSDIPLKRSSLASKNSFFQLIKKRFSTPPNSIPPVNVEQQTKHWCQSYTLPPNYLFKKIDDRTIRINIWGSPHGGKSLLVNSLLESKIINNNQENKKGGESSSYSQSYFATPGGETPDGRENSPIAYYPDSQNFARTLDLDNEKYLINKLKSFSEYGDHLFDLELLPFLLPFESPKRLYPNYRIKYGTVAELIATFPSERFLKRILFNIYITEKQSNFPSYKGNPSQLSALYVDIFCKFVGKPPREFNLNHFSQIVIVPDIQMYLGKTIRFKGLGNDFVGFDRLFIREKLFLIISTLHCFVDITLLLPSSILENNTELFVINIDQQIPRDIMNENEFLDSLFSANLNIIVPDNETPSEDIQNLIFSLQSVINKQISISPKLTALLQNPHPKSSIPKQSFSPHSMQHQSLPQYFPQINSLNQSQHQSLYHINPPHDPSVSSLQEQNHLVFVCNVIDNNAKNVNFRILGPEKVSSFAQSLEHLVKISSEQQKLKKLVQFKFFPIKPILFSSLSLHITSSETTRFKVETNLPLIIHKIRSFSDRPLPVALIQKEDSLLPSSQILNPSKHFGPFPMKLDNSPPKSTEDEIVLISHCLQNDLKSLIEITTPLIIHQNNKFSPMISAEQNKNVFDFCRINNWNYLEASNHQMCIRFQWAQLSYQIVQCKKSCPLMDRFPTISQIVALSIKQKFEWLLDCAVNQLPFIQEKLVTNTLCDCNRLYSKPIPLNFKDIDEESSHILFSSNEWISRKLLSKNRFYEQIHSNSFVLNDKIPFDVNCQFKSISLLLFGTEEAHFVIRMLAMLDIVRNYSCYSKLLRGIYELDYLYLLLNIQSGDHIALYATATFFNVNIVVFSPLFIHPIRIKPLRGETINTIYLAYVEDKIYLPLTISKNPVKHVQPEIVDQQSSIIINNNNNNNNNDSDMSYNDNMKVERFSHSSSEDIFSSSSSSNSSTASSSIASSSISPSSTPLVISPVSSKVNLAIHGSDECSSSKDLMRTARGIERRRKVRKLGSIVNRTVEIPTLSQLCIQKVVEFVDYLPTLNGVLPEELIQRLANTLIAFGKLNDTNLEKILDPSITRLSLTNCKSVRNSTCSLIAKICPNLQSISLSDCININSEGIVQIARSCRDLESIDLEGCINIDDIAVKELSLCCPLLVTVNFAGCINITNDTLKQFSRACRNIENLSLKRCTQIADPVFEELGNKLRNLDLSECNQITDDAILSISKKSERLTSLKLSGKQITDKSINQVASSSPYLRELELNGCENISDSTIQSLARGCPELNSLCLSSCKNITPAAFQTDNSKLPFYSQADSTSSFFPTLTCPFNNLQSLDLTLCVNVTDEALIHIAEQCPNLTLLNLSSCEGITDKGLISLVKKCRNIQSLNLYRCLRITDESLIQISIHCRSLKKLILRNCKITDLSILQITKHCHEITELDLSSCDKLTDESISQISIGLPSLESLYLEEVSLLTDRSISTLSSCSRIHTLKLSYCKNITHTPFSLLTEGCTLLQTLDVSHCNSISLNQLFLLIPKWTHLKMLNVKGINQSLLLDSLGHSNLEVLNLSWCKAITDDVIVKVSRSFPRLNTLDIAWCSQVTTTAIVQLVRNQPQIATLNLRGTKIPLLFVNKLSQTGRTVFS